MKLMIRSLMVLSLIIVTSFAYSETINVPGDYSTIQDAISASMNGDIIIIAPGVYYENVDFLGRSIEVASECGPDLTIIDGLQAGSVISFSNGEGPNSIINGFTIKNGSGTLESNLYRGGGVYINGSSPSLIGCILIDNIAEDGGGVGCLGPECEPSILECTIQNNKCERDGGGVYCQDSKATIRSCLIISNLADIGGGVGGRSKFYNDAPLIKESLLSDNIAESRGGGIGFRGGVAPVINANIITNNKGRDGGGINIYLGIVTDNYITHNIASDQIINNDLYAYGYGGGIAISGKVMIKNNTISHNTALSWGGGILVSGHEAVISNNLISHNVALGGGTGKYQHGGGMCIINASSAIPTLVSNCIIINNEGYLGGGFYLGDFPYDNGLVKIINCSISKNQAFRGGSIYSEGDADLHVSNSILYGNNNGEIYNKGGKHRVRVTYSNVQEGYPGKGNLNLDPLFVDPENNDFHIQLHSPCLNAGNDTDSYISRRDYENDPRVCLGQVDMGADEFHTHLYVTGNKTPAGTVQIKLLGIPGTSPIGLFLGSGSLDVPLQSSLGNWYLDFPVFLIQLWSYIPRSGLAITHKKMPLVALEKYYLQAVVGDSLSNMYVIDVE